MTPSYLLQGITLAFAWFIVVNAIVCALVISAGISLSDARPRAPAFWLATRLLPALVSIVFVTALFIPSYLKFEPRDAAEGVDLTLAALAIAAFAISCAAAVRTVQACRRVSRQTREWMRHATPLALSGTTLPAYAIDADQPIIALVGLFRPRLLVTRGLLEALTPCELAASVAHELGHQRSFDNLKRLAMCAAPDLLRPLGAAKTLERGWAAAAEHVADRLAGQDGADARCALASALVKVARLTPATPPVLGHVSTLISGGEIAARVRALLADGEQTPIGAASLKAYAMVALTVVVFVFAAAYDPILHVVHEATEILVSTLP